MVLSVLMRLLIQDFPQFVKLAVFLVVYSGVLAAIRVDYVCLPYIPESECELARYEIKVRSVTQNGHPVIKTVYAECVVKEQRGDSRGKPMFFYVAQDAIMDNEHYDTMKLPEVQSEVCRYQ